MTPGSFFYYTSLDDERKEWLKDLLLAQKIYFRSRQQLNDMNELQPRVILGGNGSEQRDYAHRIIKKYSPRVSPAKRLLQANAVLNSIMNNPAHLEADLHNILNRIGILSLSESLSAHTLWGNYARGYSGVCIEFDATKGLFATAQKVSYLTSVPIVETAIDSPEVLLQKSILTKLCDWSSEKEWRVIARWSDHEHQSLVVKQKNYPPDVAKFVMAANGPGYYEIPSESIRAIILGPKITDPNREWLTKIMSNSCISRQLVSAVRNSDGSISKRPIEQV
jgi:hypothetical protein